MKLFSNCSGECCLCACGEMCLAGHGDDDFTPASKEQIIERLDTGKYKSYTQVMKEYLRTKFGYDYVRYSNGITIKMAHWIIEDHGFGGTTYRCSECGDSWNNNYTDVSMEETCPNCGAPINEDENEYIENKKPVRDIPTIPPLYLGKFINRTDETEIIKKYEKMESKLIEASGCDMEKLIELFAAGYTLQPPSHDYTAFDFDERYAEFEFDSKKPVDVYPEFEGDFDEIVKKEWVEK